MNIRSLSNPAQVLAKDKIEASRQIKSDQTEEREGNGQQTHGDGEAHRPLTPEELEQVLKKIRSIDGIESNGLLVKLVEENGQKVVKIEDPTGKVVRRFVERDLFFYLNQSQDAPVRLVDKSA